jgi:hypothetical protein
MSDHASKTVRFQWRHFPQQILNQSPSNRRKSVAIVEAKWRQLVALAAEVESFP